MCGIWAVIGEKPTVLHHEQFMRIVGRGPDLTVVEQVQPDVFLGFHRLAIVTPGHTPSEQPVVGCGLAVVCNGEIYNHKVIKIASNVVLKNDGSDCAAIIHAFINSGWNLREACASLDGVFAFVMADENNVYIGRDPLGVRPLFYGFSGSGALVVGSEVKCIEKSIAVQSYYKIPCIADRFLSISHAQTLIREVLVSSVEKRLMGNKQFGFMLSGGLDSSLIASIATKLLMNKPIAFSVGFEDSPDLENARRVAEYLDIPHEVLIITPEECIEIIPEVIYALETFDPFVIRCGIPHYLLCRHIAKTSDVKVLLSGEGADELFGSYAYMQRAPNAFHLHKEILRRLTLLHQYDVLRCDRSTSCHGLEIRVPFLDKKFIDLVARLPPTYKLIPRKLEKFLLRSAFEGWLPEEVLWRSKEGFSEALGKTDIGDIVHRYASSIITEEMFAERADRFPDRVPETPEEYWYRQIFEDTFHYGKVGPLVHTKVYRTAAWQMVEKEENIKKSLDIKQELQAMMRFRRRSTGSATLSGVA
ncbi:asparagine synthase [Necator americanus]|uniref:Asparagine synthetase [glutamine-hydrolyzing] n=1 Tax=Necator americanus TaxID=51031 RepID=W2SWG0_NECAM|nr:asparagine synthase [Necator americanus]ETN73037.1 asparagine synthase [Necator americanus]